MNLSEIYFFKKKQNHKYCKTDTKGDNTHKHIQRQGTEAFN